MDPGQPIDARCDRAAQGAAGVVLLSAFVFGVPWAVPVVGLLLVGGALIGPHADAFQLLFAILMLPRLPEGDAVVPAETVRAQDIALAVLLGAASLSFLVVTSLGWLLAIVAAVVAIVAASTGLHLGEWAVTQLLARRPPP